MSIILDLHARYEAAWAEFNVAEAAQPAKPKNGDSPDFKLYFRLEDGMHRNSRETDALRLAILYQVPATDEEATVLAFHCWGLFDPASSPTKDETHAIEEGLNSIFDYLVSEGRADMDKMGAQFTHGALIAFDRRRYRTGKVED
jgi:hypothetical protein